jgi:hypothetical protein
VFVIKSEALQLLLNQVIIAGTGRTEFRLYHVLAECYIKETESEFCPPEHWLNTVSSTKQELYSYLLIKSLTKEPIYIMCNLFYYKDVIHQIWLCKKYGKLFCFQVSLYDLN